MHDISYDLVGFVNYSRKELVKKNNGLQGAMPQFNECLLISSEFKCLLLSVY